ncbi:MAG: sulfite exporter TauE/SafE family protein [Rhodospirillales bacterium]|nr:sulfite exporter TauE/SafE family protein [Rhodospirillales bacterium]MDE2199438.1 sulfite exporter TauE/SafE family protein [Rhodospirillales bacterium]
MLSITTLVVLGGAFGGGFISGLVGFGTGLMALGIWLYVLAPSAASSLVAVCSVLSQVQTIPLIWHAIDRRRIWPMLAAGLLGVPVGTRLLSFIDPITFHLAMGGLLIGFSSFMLFGRRETRLLWGGQAADSAIGFLGGLLGGLAGLSGPFPTMWSALRGWSKDERRGVIQTFNLTILSASLLSHAAAGLLTRDFGRLVLLALPGTVGGSWLGIYAYRRLSDHHFHRIVLGVLGLSGLTLLWSSL